MHFPSQVCSDSWNLDPSPTKSDSMYICKGLPLMGLQSKATKAILVTLACAKFTAGYIGSAAAMYLLCADAGVSPSPYWASHAACQHFFFDWHGLVQPSSSSLTHLDVQ